MLSTPFPPRDFQPRNTALKWDFVVTNVIKPSGAQIFNSLLQGGRDTLKWAYGTKNKTKTKQNPSRGDSKQAISVKVPPGLFRQTATTLPTTEQLKWKAAPSWWKTEPWEPTPSAHCQTKWKEVSPQLRRGELGFEPKQSGLRTYIFDSYTHISSILIPQ